MTVLNLHDVPVKYGSAVAHTVEVENRVLEQRDGGPAFQGIQVPSEHWWDFLHKNLNETSFLILKLPLGAYIHHQVPTSY